MRNNLVVLHDIKTKAIHFSETVLAGEDNNNWIPFDGDKDDLFITIESLMTGNDIANNIASIEYLRTCGHCIEYTVTYNEAVVVA